MISKVDHIGIAVRDLEAAKELFEKCLGVSPCGGEEVPEQKVKVSFFRLESVGIELLESTSPDGPIGRYIEKRGPGIHHVALGVDDIEGELARLKASGVRLIDESPRAGAHGTKVAFVHPSAAGGVLIELCQKIRGTDGE